MKEKVDIKYLGIPNICFSLTKEDDKREKEYKKQRIERGFDNSELWSLRDTIGNFILPRLKAFKENKVGFPACFETDEEWRKILSKMVIAFELLVRDSGTFDLTKGEMKQYDKGMKLFHEYFLNLWN